jgi:adenylate cyclase
VHELICPEEEVTENDKLLCACFKEGLNAFKRKSWEEGMILFREAVNIKGKKDGPSDFYLKLCNKFLKNPPGEEWNGIVFIRKK